MQYEFPAGSEECYEKYQKILNSSFYRIFSFFTLGSENFTSTKKRLCGALADLYRRCTRDNCVRGMV